MSEMFNPHAPATAYDHNTTIVAVLELSGKSWLFGAVAPGLPRRVKRSFAARDVEAVARAIEQVKAQSARANFEAQRIVVGFESGCDGFWIARALQQRGFEVYVMHAASIAVERRGKRAKTDRLDVDLLLTTLIGWLRGEPGRCTMAPIPSEEEEDLREPGRRRETLVKTRLKVENQISSLLIRHGIAGFKPRLKNCETRLDELRTFDGRPLPANMMKSLGLLLAQHRLLSTQLKEIEEARQQVVKVAKPDRWQLMIQTLARVVGVGVETAIVLVYEVFSRSFKDRRALAAFVGLTGTPYNSGGSETEQGISKNGNARVRRMLSQLAWRWLMHQPESALAQWFNARLNGAKGRMKKILIVALMRKLVIALWRLAETGEVPVGARLALR